MEFLVITNNHKTQHLPQCYFATHKGHKEYRKRSFDFKTVLFSLCLLCGSRRELVVNKSLVFLLLLNGKRGFIISNPSPAVSNGALFSKLYRPASFIKMMSFLAPGRSYEIFRLYAERP